MMWKRFQNIMRKYRLAVGKCYWDRKKKEEFSLEGKPPIQSILFLRQDGKVGDMVAHTMIFREIKKQYPEMRIAVITRGAAKKVIEQNPHVDKIYEYDKKNIGALARKIENEKYDILVDFSVMLRVRDMKLISLCKARYNFGVNREEWKLFDVSIPFSFQEHISNLYIIFLKKIGIPKVERGYELFFTDVKKKEEYMVLNPYAASHNRSFQKDMILKIAKRILSYPTIQIYLMGEKSKEKELMELAKILGNRAHPLVSKEISEIFPIIKNSCFVLTPDTSIVHIAVALQKDMIAVYRKDREGEFNSVVWGPNSEKAHVLYSDERDVNDWKTENWECLEQILEKILEKK